MCCNMCYCDKHWQFAQSVEHFIETISLIILVIFISLDSRIGQNIDQCFLSFRKTSFKFKIRHLQFYCIVVCPTENNKKIKII